MNYDLCVSDAKRKALNELLILQRSDSKIDVTQMASALDNLNKMWDLLTDALVRQRSERDSQILRLIDELAEAKKGR